MIGIRVKQNHNTFFLHQNNYKINIKKNFLARHYFWNNFINEGELSIYNIKIG
jgi:hypothetical protein